MTKEADVTCPLHESIKDRVEKLEECIDAIKTASLKNSRLFIGTLVMIIISMTGFFFAQVYFKINSPPTMSQERLKTIISETVKEYKK